MNHIVVAVFIFSILCTGGNYDRTLQLEVRGSVIRTLLAKEGSCVRKMK